MFAVVLEVRLLPMSMKFPPGTINRRYPRICDSPIRFNCEEFTVENLRWLLFRIVSVAATSPVDVPVPLNRRMAAIPPDLCEVAFVAVKVFVPFAGVLPSSSRTPQAVNAREITTREATIRTRRISGSGTREYITSVEQD